MRPVSQPLNSAVPVTGGPLQAPIGQRPCEPMSRIKWSHGVAYQAEPDNGMGASWWITAGSAVEIISVFAEVDLSPIGHAGGTRECPVDTERVELRLVAHAIGYL
jgi:hypothetical protein